jgi:hypothetical protein
MYTKCELGNFKGQDHLTDLDVDVKIIMMNN